MTVFVIGLLMLARWVFDSAIRNRVLPELVPVQVLIAIAVVLSGVSLWLLQTKRATPRTRRVAHGCAVVVVLVGGLSLSASLFGGNLGIDQQWFKEPLDVVGASASERMALAIALNLLLIGLALLLLDVETRRGQRPAQFLMLLEGALAWLALVGYIYDVTSLSGGMTASRPMTPSMIFAFVLVCAGILCARPNLGLMAIFTNNGISGVMARRLTFVAIVMPLALDMLVLWGTQAGLYSLYTGSAIHVVLIVGVLIALAFVTSWSLERMETERERLEAQVRQYTTDLEHLVGERTVALRAARDFADKVIEVANSLITVHAPDGTITLFNRQCEETTGYSSEEVIGYDWFTTLFPAEVRDESRQHFNDVLEGQIPDVWEAPLLTKAGHLRTVRWRNSVLRDSAGRVTGVISIGLDVTEQRRLEGQVLQAERLAVVGRMAAQVAHEIRNPLSSISLNLELLADEIREHDWADRNEAENLIQMALSEIGRLNEVIHDYLQFARMPAKQRHVESLNTLVTELVKLVHPEAERIRVRLIPNLGTNVPAVLVDRTRIEQALLNCVRNALEAMPGGGTLTFVTRATEGGVELSITDTGAGVPPEHLEKVFDPFYSTKTKGTGLGLPYVRQVVTEHGGQVLLQSTPGVGTTVTIRLDSEGDCG